MLADGTVAEEPVVRIAPRDLAVLIDRLQNLFGRPAQISEGRGFAAAITSEALPLRCPPAEARGAFCQELTGEIGIMRDRQRGLGIWIALGGGDPRDGVAVTDGVTGSDAEMDPARAQNLS